MPRYMYFPSCNFTRLFPEESEKLKNFLRERGVEIAGCCGSYHANLPAGVIPLTICQTCALIIQENHPEQPPVSLFEYLDALPDLELPDHQGATVVLQDCFRARNHVTEKRAIRSLLAKMHFEVTDAPDQEHFDGRFLMAPMRPGNLKLAPKAFGALEAYTEPCTPEEADAKLKTYGARFCGETVVSYCSACWQGLRDALPEGKQCMHIAQYLTEKLS